MKKTTKVDKLKNYIEYLKEKNITEVNICVHDAPDPDAFGSAFGLSLILKHFGISSKILYRGEVSHPQNKTMINVLNILAEKVTEDIDNKAENICVDCTINNSCAEYATFTIDHHKIKSGSKFEIVEPSYGSCATIVWNLMKELSFLDDSEKKSPENIIVFTALLLGIRTDTFDLTSEKMTKEDFSAYQELLELSDKESLQKIMNYPYPRYLYERRTTLHEKGNSHEVNGVFVGGVGFLPTSQRDVIAILADEYARMESVNTAVIFAIIDKKHLEVSVRSSNVSLDVNQMCKDYFGSFGGGTSYKGGAKIPLNFYSEVDDKYTDDFWVLTCNHMFKKIHKESWKEDKKK